MKKVLIFLLLLNSILVSNSYAEWVNGYFTSNGAWVNGYFRSNRNSTVTDNYSYYGNVNPYTGSVGTNKYSNNPTSEYYNSYDTYFYDFESDLYDFDAWSILD